MIGKRILIIGDNWWDMVSMEGSIGDNLHDSFLEGGFHGPSDTCSFYRDRGNAGAFSSYPYLKLDNKQPEC